MFWQASIFGFHNLSFLFVINTSLSKSLPQVICELTFSSARVLVVFTPCDTLFLQIGLACYDVILHQILEVKVTLVYVCICWGFIESGKNNTRAQKQHEFRYCSNEFSFSMSHNRVILLFVIPVAWHVSAT